MTDKITDSVKTNWRTLFSTGFFHIFGSNVFNKVIAFLSTAVLVRVLTKSEYGIYTYSWNIYSIIVLFNGLGLVSALLQLCSERGNDPEYDSVVGRYSVKTGLLFDILLGLVIVLVAIFAPLKFEGAGTILLLLAVMPAAQFLFDLIQSIYRAQKRNQEFSRLSMLNAFFLFVFSVAGAFLFRERGMVIGMYLSLVITTIYGYGKLGLPPADSRQITGQDRKALLSIGTISMFNNGISSLLYLLDVFVLGIVAKEETILAGYKVATLIPTNLIFIPQSLVTYLYPYFAEHRNDGRWCLKNYKKVLTGIGSVNAVIMLVMCLFPKLIIRLFFGSQYLDIVPIFRILAINYFIGGTFRTIAGNLLVTQRKLRFNLAVAIISGVTNAVADYFFILRWGAIGAAYATVLVVLIASILNVSYLLFTFKKAAE